MDRNHHITLPLLVAGLVFYTIVTIGVAVLLPKDRELYALMAGILGLFSGALFMFLKAGGPPPPPPTPTTP